MWNLWRPPVPRHDCPSGNKYDDDASSMIMMPMMMIMMILIMMIMIKMMIRNTKKTFFFTFMIIGVTSHIVKIRKSFQF